VILNKELLVQNNATGGTAGGAVSVTRTQKQKPGVKVKANGPLATGTHSSGAGSEAPVFLKAGGRGGGVSEHESLVEHADNVFHHDMDPFVRAAP
jgi:hypothetical protein